jgi:hypothetical protein
LVPERNASRSLEPNRCFDSNQVLQGMVSKRNPYKIRTNESGRSEDQGKIGQRSELLYIRSYQFGSRRPEEQDHVNKTTMGGFRNVENFKTAIFFNCGGLDLYPQ